MSTLFHIGLAMLAGLLLTKVTHMLHLPNVTAYLIAGLLIGPYVFNFVKSDTIESFEIITECALGFIAFSIGDEFKIENIKAVGKPVLTITFFESTMAVGLVMCVTLACGYDPVICMVLGALAASTAPAATLLIVRQYKAQGPLTNHLLPVVAADDATGLIAYSICISIAKSMVQGVSTTVGSAILEPIFNVLISILVGAVLGFLLALTHRFFKSNANRISFCITFILIGVGIADYFNLSDLLLCMMLGAVYINIWENGESVLDGIEDWTYPLFMLFFVISGAQLDLSILPQVGVLGLIYVIVRFAGKFMGSFIGARISKCPKVVQQNIGWALMPQAGVAIGMATMALSELPHEYGQLIQTVILSATLIYEIIGPVTTKNALKRAGEIKL